MRAFNYETQTWVEGKEGIELSFAQAAKELTLLHSAEGQRYLDSIGSKLTLQEAILCTIQHMEHCKNLLASLYSSPV